MGEIGRPWTGAVPRARVVSRPEPESVHALAPGLEVALAAVGLDWRQHVRQDPRFLRPAEPTNLVGDASRARAVLGWNPEFGFEQLITEMTRAELTRGAAGA